MSSLRRALLWSTTLVIACGMGAGVTSLPVRAQDQASQNQASQNQPGQNQTGQSTDQTQSSVTSERLLNADQEQGNFSTTRTTRRIASRRSIRSTATP
jgi:hypothetical protein